MSKEFAYPYDGSEITLILVYGCEDYTLHPIGSSKNNSALAFGDAHNEARARDKEAAEALLASAAG